MPLIIDFSALILYYNNYTDYISRAGRSLGKSKYNGSKISEI